MPGQTFGEYCEICHDKRTILMDEDCQENLCKWLFGKKSHKYTVCAHNFRSYDGYFIMDYLRREGFKINHVENGG